MYRMKVFITTDPSKSNWDQLASEIESWLNSKPLYRLDRIEQTEQGRRHIWTVILVAKK